MDEMFAVKCLEGESTQRVFECPFCGNKIGVADLLKPGTFNKRLTMGIDAEYVTEQGIPCEISPQQAHVNALHEAFCQVLFRVIDARHNAFKDRAPDNKAVAARSAFLFGKLLTQHLFPVLKLPDFLLSVLNLGL